MLWDATTGDLVHTFSHRHIVRTCAFSNDGTKVITGSRKKMLRLFDLSAPETAMFEVSQASPITRALMMPGSILLSIGSSYH